MNIFKKLSAFLVLFAVLLAGCKKDKYDFDSLHPTVKSFFKASSIQVDIDDQIEFTNTSEQAETYTWDFGDGTGSNEVNPTKAYGSAGIFTVILKAVGPGGTGTYSVDVTVLDPNANVNNHELYFIEYSNRVIKKISLEPGSTVEVVADISDNAGVGLAYDDVNEKVYFTDFENTDDGKIWRMNLDGSNMEQLVSGITDPYSITINLAGGKIYWADDAGNISRANLDGTGLEREFIHIDNGNMRGIAFDNKAGIIYFYEVNKEDLYAAKADGTGVSKVIEGAYGYCIFVDEINSKLYYEDRNKTAVMQANLDGSGIVKIADAPSTRIHGMAIDYSTDKFYWADRDKGIIRRANLDGTANEAFLSGLRSPRGLFIK